MPEAEVPPRRWGPVVGPLFAWELVRLARRGQDMRARSILVGVLLLTLFAFVALWFPTASLGDLFLGSQQTIKIEQTARFAEQFSLTLLLAQLGVMVLLAPAYAAGSIAEEKERKTFPYLLASDLSSREIVLGKYLARVVFLLGVLAAGLPVFALTGLVGGIDPLFLISAYVLTGGTIVVIAAASVAASVYANTFRGAMFRAYGMTALYSLFGCVHPFASPFAAIVFAFYQRGGSSRLYFIGMGAYLLGQAVVTIIALALAVRRLRGGRRVVKPPRERTANTAKIVPDRDPAPAPYAKRLPIAMPIESVPRRPVYNAPGVSDRPKVFADDPFFWKEKYTLGGQRTADEEAIRGVTQIVGVMVVAGLGLFAFTSFVMALGSPFSNRDSAGRILLLAGTGATFAHLLTLGAAAVQTVLRERQRQTLESLLTIPVDRRDILWPKWKVCAGRGWWWGGPGLAAVVVGLLLSRVGFAGLAAVAYLPAVVGFAVSFGLWLSVRCATTARALMYYLATVGAFVALPLLASWLFDESLRFAAFLVLAAGAVGAAAGGFYFWRRACREFNADGRE